MGAIMAVGVAVSNGDSAVTFAERRAWRTATRLPPRLRGGRSRLRPFLMTVSS